MVDAPAGLLTEELRADIVAHKPAILRLLEEERRIREQANEQGLMFRWSEAPTWIDVHDPMTGEWHQWPAADCFPSMVSEANRHREKGERVWIQESRQLSFVNP